MLYRSYPDSVTVGGVKYPVNTDFRLMMSFELSVQKKGDTEKIIRDFYCGNIPEDVNGAVNAMIDFYLCGAKPEGKTGGGSVKRCYAYDEDWKYITAAFRQQYGIDLNKSDMHWWEFSALFTGLTDNTEFVKIMQYRCTDLRKIKNAEEKARIRRLQQRYALEENRVKKYASAAERDAAMLADIKRRHEALKEGVNNG